MSNSFRVTHRSIGMRAMHGLQSNLDRLGTLQQQLSSGRQLSRPSDSPTGTVSALRLRAEIRTSEQYVRNADDGLGYLATVDQALNTSLTTLRVARERTLQGMNSGSASPSSRLALASEVSALRENLLGEANKRYLNRPVFGGTTLGSVAYDASGTFVGDTNAVLRTVGDGTSIRVDASGPQVFGLDGGDDAFRVLADIADHLTNAPGDLGDDLTRLDQVIGNVMNRVAEVGARTNRMEQMRTNAEDRGITLQGSLAEVESIDLPKTIVELQMQEAAYQAALGATQRVVQPSLVDFLR